MSSLSPATAPLIRQVAYGNPRGEMCAPACSLITSALFSHDLRPLSSPGIHVPVVGQSVGGRSSAHNSVSVRRNRGGRTRAAPLLISPRAHKAIFVAHAAPPARPYMIPIHVVHMLGYERRPPPVGYERDPHTAPRLRAVILPSVRPRPPTGCARRARRCVSTGYCRPRHLSCMRGQLGGVQ